MLSQKGFTPILLLIGLTIVVISGVTGYYIYSSKQNLFLNQNQKSLNITSSTPSSIQKNGWKTYINTNYGYQVNYPSNWVVTPILEGSNDRDQAVLISSSSATLTDLSTIDGVPDESVYIESNPIPINYTFEQWWNSSKQHFGITISNTLAPDYSKITFPRDRITMDATDNSTGRLEWETILIWKDNYVYTISAKNQKGVWNDQPFGDIVASITPQPNAARLQWHTYNSLLGFSIEVPNITSAGKDQFGNLNFTSTLNGMLYDNFGHGINLTISEISNPQHLSIPEWYRQSLLNGNAGTGSATPVTPQEAADLSQKLPTKSFGNNSGYSASVFGGDNEKEVDYIAHGDKIYEFVYESENPNVSDTAWELLVEQKMINSVKFNN